MSAIRRLLSLVVVGGIATSLCVVSLIPGVLVLARSGRSATPLADELRPLVSRSIVYAADGSVLAVLHAEQDRDPAKLEEVPQVLVNAIVDIEDRGFFRHNGVDLKSSLRAFLINAEAGKVEQGGSTITQQLLKNALVGDARTLDRKVKEAFSALRLEGEITKEEILERYLNTVYFGQSAYGVRAAAERFFGKALADVTTPEAALLAGSIANPSAYDPFVNPDRARSRRSEVLSRMVAEGHLDAELADKYSEAPLPASLAQVQPKPNTHFVEEVKRRLLRDERLGETPQDRYQAVFGGGLRIYTTLDPKMQVAAESAVKEILPESQFTAALVAVDVSSGAVRALVGGPGFEQSKFNLATQGVRQTGSAFKAITLAAALDAGYTINSSVDGTKPCEFKLRGGQKWRVDGDFEGGGGGVISLRSATAQSVNCAFAQLAVTLGPERIVKMAKRLGITSELEAVPSITLGSEEVSPLEMAGAFATFAADGVYRTPYFVRRIEKPDGATLFSSEVEGKRVLEAEIARAETLALEGVIKGGTGGRASIGRPAAGKTGTSTKNWDAWFVGYTPQVSAAVWMGSPKGQIPMRSVGGITVFGGTYPARIWAAFMKAAHEGKPVRSFTPANPRSWPSSRRVASNNRVSVATTTTTLFPTDGFPEGSATTLPLTPTTVLGPEPPAPTTTIGP